MMLLSAMLFYATIIFSYSFGIIVTFNLGRYGMSQLLLWLLAIPQPDYGASDTTSVLGEVFDFPTSLEDVLASFLPLGWVKTIGTFISEVRNVYGRTLAHISGVFGRRLGRLWFMVGIPVFVAYAVLAAKGYHYLPAWFQPSLIPTTTINLVVFAVYASAYALGRIVSSPQRAFNRARLGYESIVRRNGYWFDNLNEQGVAYGSRAKKQLRKSLETFETLKEALEGKDQRDELAEQQLCVLNYQMALAYCTLFEIDAAQKALARATVHLAALKEEELWGVEWLLDERGKHLFLEAEMLFVGGNFVRSATLFERSLEISRDLDDQYGEQKCVERLATVEHTKKDAKHNEEF